MPTAIVTGASRGLGLALARALAERSWDLVIDARGAEALRAATDELAATGVKVRAHAGDIAWERHRRALIGAASSLGRLDLLVNNASVLGPSPQPELRRYPIETLESVYHANVFGPLRLVQLALLLLEASGRGRVLNITSDAAVEGYPGWGGYGSSKAALEQLSRVLAVEHAELRVYWADPGDMRTRMHQEAYPGQDISDRPPPEASVPGLLRLIDGDLPSGRYRTADLTARAEATPA
jgi:NAD(P)-dependent dehydrogenase (short-subunit alcohol dehydrogenase family)